jgi:hypothetical protein
MVRAVLDRGNAGFATATGRVHPKDSADYEVLDDLAASRALGASYALKMRYDVVLYYARSVKLRDLPIWHERNVCVVVAKHLVVAGDIAIDDPCALVVLGDVSCASYSSSEAEVFIRGKLTASRVADVEYRSGGVTAIGSIDAPVVIVDVDDAPATRRARVVRLDGGEREAAFRNDLLPRWRTADERKLRAALRAGTKIFQA